MGYDGGRRVPRAPSARQASWFGEDPHPRPLARKRNNQAGTNGRATRLGLPEPGQASGENGHDGAGALDLAARRPLTAGRSG